MRWSRRSMMCLAILAGWLCVMPTLATEVKGEIKGQDGHGKAWVRVDFVGAVNRVAVTNDQGHFQVTLPGGSYKVRVSSGMWRHESMHSVKDTGEQLLPLQVNW